jgi:cell wall assembly regulator SMI1
MSIADSWKRYAKWLEKNAPSLVGRLSPGVNDAELAAFEKEVGAPLPATVRELWNVCGGQQGLNDPGVIGDFVLLSPKSALAEWRSWAELRRDTSEENMANLARYCTSQPAGAIQEGYSVAGWIPLWKERMEGNYVGVDLEPGPNGVVGQVIGFGRDEDEKRVLFWDYAAAIAWLADQALSLEDDRLAHRDGRILSVLSSQAEAGKLPPGKKPKATRAKPKIKAPAPAPARAKKPAAGPAAVPALPPAAQAALDAYVALLRETLERHAKDLPQREAVSEQRADNPAQPRASVIGSPLSMIPDAPEIDADTNPLRKPFPEILELSQQGGLTLSQIRIHFRREAGGWQHAIAIETAENRKRLTAARQPLDRELVAALIAFIDRERPEWERATLGYDERPDVARPGLTVVSLRPPVVVGPSPELRALFDRMLSLHAEFGVTLRYATWNVMRAKPDKPNVNTVYG